MTSISSNNGDYMNVYAFIPLIAIIAYIPLLITTMSARPWKRLHRLFILFLVAAIFWSLADFLARSDFVPQLRDVWLRIILITFTWMVIQFHYFTSSFFPPNKSRWLPFALITLTGAAILLATGLFDGGIIVEGNRLYPQYGNSIFILAIPLIILLARNLYVFIPRLKYKENPIIYNQTVTVLITLIVLTAFVIIGISPVAREYSLSHLSNIVNAVILSYAVVGHQLVDIRSVLRRGLIWLIIIVISLISYCLLLFVFDTLLNVEFNLLSVFASSVAFVLIAAFIYRLRNVISSSLHKAIQGQTYYYQQKLVDFSNQIHNIFSLKDQGGELLKLLTLSLDCKKAALLFWDADSEDFIVQLAEPKEIGNPLTELRLKKDNPIVAYLNREHRTLTSENIFILPELRGLWPQEKSIIETSQIELFIPLISRDKVIGILILDKKNTGSYSLDDYSLLDDVTKRVAVSMEKEYLREQLKEREEELSIINRSSAIITSNLDIQRIYDNFIKELKLVIDVDWASIAIIEEQELYILALSSEVGSPWRVGERIALKGTATEWVSIHRRASVNADLSVDTQFSTGKYHLQHNIRSIANIPLLVSNEVIGSLIVASRKPNAYNQRNIKLLEQLASQIAMPIENARLYAKTERMARNDELTGLLNRRSLDEILPSEIGRHSRYGGIFSLVIIDLDDFKSFNDNYGHLVGDELLRQVGGIMKDAIREADQAFRYGGDEFAILLPQTAMDSALKVADRVRQQVFSKVEIGSTAITLSLGLASWPADGISSNELIAAADTALYTAKRSGGNRCQCASGTRMPSVQEMSAGISEDSESLSNIFALAATVDARDHYTRIHSQRVHEYALAVAAELGMEDLEANRLGTCALLHDIGKIGISDEILNKNEKLNDQEWEAIKAHPHLGAAIASHSSQLAPCVSGILHHHERFDGTGYPDGLRGSEIPLESRILAIADSFAAMTYTRAYANALSYEVAMEEIKKGAGTQFDPKLVEVFLQALEKMRLSKEQDKIGTEKN